ncbi:EamA family transporter [Anaerotignum lactatifermentans]|uniref:EamA family transporter n=1 Tax=Anaerotignum lactatifermentans TaxID=160404 RepID=A0ABS2GB35_9FIRM|nr:EamA family transporter [Anaerotignum lactatifermentans]MBM6878711.1 EamA family transporter [Anaerotignum lactatifermentans]MBM6951757.1 EamA family transporter [Anaerotignum lactatifermentans]
MTLAGGICWGISGCFGQYLFQQKDVTSNWLVSVRLLVAGILLLAIGRWRMGKDLNAFFHDRKDLRKVLIFSVFGMLFCQYFYFSAVEYSNAGTATVLQSLAPFVILAIVCIRGLRLPKGREVIAVFAAVSGVFLLSTHGNIHNMMLTEQALFFGLASAAGAAAYNLLSAEMLSKYGVYPVVGYGMLFGGIVLTVIVWPWRYGLIWDSGTIIALFGVIVIGTAVAFSLYLKGVSMVGPFMGSLLGMVEPVTAIVVSFLFLDTKFQWIDLVGFVLILGTVLLMSLRSPGREATKKS